MPMSPLNNFRKFFFRKIAIFVTFIGDYTIRFLKQFEKNKILQKLKKTLVSPHFPNANFKPIVFLRFSSCCNVSP